MKTMRIAFWGLGRHAIGKLLPAASSTAGLEIAGVCSRDAARVAESAESWGCRGWTDPAAMLADEGVDIVYVATPIALHAEHSERVLAANKHVWCEKPVTGDRATAASLVQSSQRSGLAVLEGYMYLHHPQFRHLQAFVAEGRLDAVFSIVCRFGLPRLEHPGFRVQPDLGGGALLDVGCYPVSALIALFPEQTYRVRDATLTTRERWMVDTDGHALIECGNGAIAQLEWRINASYRNDIDVWGEQGSISTDRIFSKPPDFVPTFRVRNVRGFETIEEGQAGDHFALMFSDFRQIMDDEAAIERARRAVVLRATLLDNILTRARDEYTREV